ncbi:MAG: hypothetical protein IIB90_00150 [Gemmatimonadetes bacterium]|nr:hypothetical protein [Gemmatimonadota bacterium]
MRYFHRTQLSPDKVLAEADRHFGLHLEEIEHGERARRYNGSLGTVGVTVLLEGGHYVHITVQTDQVGESELDKLAKRFLGQVHKLAHPDYQLRGAY